jgi:hypothetical protein
MFRVLNTDAQLVCNHGAGKVRLGPGADFFVVRGKPALRVSDVLHRPVEGCPYCRLVQSVQLGEEACLSLGGEDVLTELAFGATNAGVWSVLPAPGWSVQIGLTVDLSRSQAAPDPARPQADRTPEPAEKEWSGPLFLREWRSFLCPKPEPGAFEPDPQPLDACGLELPWDRPVNSPWLYVFAVGAGGRLRLDGEYLVWDGETVQQVRSGLRSAGTPPEPELAPTGPLRLPLKGGRAAYAFFASHVRLTRRALDRIARCPELRPVEVTRETVTVAVTNPLTVAEGLARRYVSARDLLLEYGLPTETAGLPSRPMPQRILLARLLQQIIDGDPNDRLGLDEKLRDGRSVVQQNLDTYAQEVSRLAYWAEQAAEQLTRWLTCALWQATVSAYQTYPDPDFVFVLKVYGACVDRLKESEIGRKFLDKVLKNRRHFVHPYVPPAPTPDRWAPDRVFEVVRKTPEAVVQIWEALVAPTLHRGRGPILDAWVVSLRVALRLSREALDWEKLSGKLVRVWRQSQFIEVSLEFGLKLVRPSAVLNRAAKGVNALLANEALFTRLQLALELVNVGLAVQKVLGGEKIEQGRNAFEFLGAAVDALNAAARLLSTLEPAEEMFSGRLLGLFARRGVLTGLGAASGLLDAIGGGLAVHRALSMNNPKAAAGPALTALGGWMAFVSVVQATPYAVLLGWFAKFPRAGLVGVALLALGALTSASIGTETEIQKFARSSEWGKARGKRGDLSRPNWAGKAFPEWAGDPETQVRALCRLLAAFRIQATWFRKGFLAGFLKARIHLGSLLLPTTRVEVVFDFWHFLDAIHRPGFAVEWGGPRVWPIPGRDAADMGRVWKHETNQECWLEVETAFPLERPGHPVHHIGGATCRVRVDVFGDGRLYVPGPTAWVNYEVPSVSGQFEFKFMGEASSLDVDCGPDAG